MALALDRENMPEELYTVLHKGLHRDIQLSQITQALHNLKVIMMQIYRKLNEIISRETLR